MMTTAPFMAEATNGGSVIRTSTAKNSAQNLQALTHKEAPIDPNILHSIKALQIKFRYTQTKVMLHIKMILPLIPEAFEVPTAEILRQGIHLLIHQMVITNIENNSQ